MVASLAWWWSSCVRATQYAPAHLNVRVAIGRDVITQLTQHNLQLNGRDDLPLRLAFVNTGRARALTLTPLPLLELLLLALERSTALGQFPFERLLPLPLLLQHTCALLLGARTGLQIARNLRGLGEQAQPF